MWRLDFLLPSQHFHCEGLDYLFVTFTAFSLWRFRFFTPFWIFLRRKCFLGMDIRILFTLMVFCSEVSGVKNQHISLGSTKVSQPCVKMAKKSQPHKLPQRHLNLYLYIHDSLVNILCLHQCGIHNNQPQFKKWGILNP